MDGITNSCLAAAKGGGAMGFLGGDGVNTPQLEDFGGGVFKALGGGEAGPFTAMGALPLAFFKTGSCPCSGFTGLAIIPDTRAGDGTAIMEGCESFGDSAEASIDLS